MIDVARAIAAQHPQAKLPCPVCANPLRAENLDGHLAKVHAGAASVAEWRGKGLLFPATLAIDDDVLVLRRWYGTRRQALPAPLEVGSIWVKRPEPGMSSYADDTNVPHVDVRVGSYLRVGTTTIGCKQDIADVWTGWQRGPRRKSCHVRVAREVLVAIEYALAKRGMLAPSAAG